MQHTDIRLWSRALRAFPSFGLELYDRLQMNMNDQAKTANAEILEEDQRQI